VTYTFTLRSAARWSDGERVTAEDFVYAWQRLVDPATASPNASLLSMVAGYDEVRESGDVSLLGVKAKGESTFLVTLSRPCAYFITSVCTSPATAPLRRDLVEGNASWAATADIVTNGPYTVGTWVKAAQLQTKRNGEYYESKLVVPDSICFRFETDAQTNYDQLLAGELDYTAKLPYAAIEQLAEDETWQPAPLAETVYLNILNQAQQYIYIYTPYLAVGEEMLDALKNAAKRGVDVRLVLPGIPDKKLVFRLSRSYYVPLLRAGVRIYEFAPGFLHSKCYVSDDHLAVVGSINMDYRSLFLHFECGVLLLQNSQVLALRDDVRRTLYQCREVQCADCRTGLVGTVLDSVLRLLSPLM